MIPSGAEAVISEEMQELGAVKVNGVWHYNGEPVEIIVLIRVEDERREVGDYLASLLEDLGFVVDRQYKTAARRPPIWISSDPNEGLFHIYTGGWVSTAVDRDLGNNFDFYYNPRGLPYRFGRPTSPRPALTRSPIAWRATTSLRRRAPRSSSPRRCSLHGRLRPHLLRRQEQLYPPQGGAGSDVRPRGRRLGHAALAAHPPL